jgi:hypothetical protein
MRFVATLLFVGLLFFSRSAFAADDVTWSPGEPPPPGYHVVDSARRGRSVAAVGLETTVVAFALSYVVMSYRAFGCIIGNAGSEHPRPCSKELLLLIPVAGPFLLNAAQPAESWWPAVFLLDGGIQAAGLVVALVGLGMASEKPSIARDAARIRVLPMAGRARGISAVMTF